MISTRSTRFSRPLLALALLPAAGGIAFATVGASAGAADVRSAHVQIVRSTSGAVEAGDDSGGHGGRTSSIRTPEAGDDDGGHHSVSHGGGSGHSGRSGGHDDGPHHS